MPFLAAFHAFAILHSSVHLCLWNRCSSGLEGLGLVGLVGLTRLI